MADEGAGEHQPKQESNVINIICRDQSNGEVHFKVRACARARAGLARGVLPATSGKKRRQEPCPAACFAHNIPASSSRSFNSPTASLNHPLAHFVRPT